MSDFGPDFGSDFGPANGAAYQAQSRFNVGIPSPVGSVVLLGTSGIAVIGNNPVRRGIQFWNPGNVILYVNPSNHGAIAGWGVIILPGASVRFIGRPERNISINCGWFGIAATGSNNPLTVLELL